MYMDDGEIIRDYRAAKNKKEQVGVLADLNGVTEKQMATFLADNGEEVDGRYLKKKAPAPTVKAIKCYIAGKISGNHFFKEEFQIVEDWLREHGFEPVNPAKNTGDGYKDYIDQGLKQLMECDAICLIEGWVTSVGATLERDYADTVGLPRIFMPDKIWHDRVTEALEQKRLESIIEENEEDG